jgi:hypothetical protein
MGCDIHLFVEKLVDGKWEMATGFESNYYDKDSDFFSAEQYRNGPTPYDGRNYHLFAFLAGVRNQQWTDKFNLKRYENPVFEGRGIPANASDCIAKDFEDWGCDAHSASFATLSELKGIDPSSVVANSQGVIKESQYIEMLNGKMPTSWSGGVSGPSIEVVSCYEMDSIIDGTREREHGVDYRVSCTWKESGEVSLSGFFEHVIPQLDKISDDENSEDVRIVFWFDN